MMAAASGEHLAPPLKPGATHYVSEFDAQAPPREAKPFPWTPKELGEGVKYPIHTATFKPFSFTEYYANDRVEETEATSYRSGFRHPLRWPETPARVGVELAKQEQERQRVQFQRDLIKAEQSRGRGPAKPQDLESVFGKGEQASAIGGAVTADPEAARKLYWYNAGFSATAEEYHWRNRVDTIDESRLNPTPGDIDRVCAM